MILSAKALEAALPWILGIGAVGAAGYVMSNQAPAPGGDSVPVQPLFNPVQNQPIVEMPGWSDPSVGQVKDPISTDSGMVSLDQFQLKFNEPYQNKSVVSLGECIAAMKNGNPYVFDFPRPVQSYLNNPVGQANKKIIMITSLEDMKAVCDNLILPAFMVYKAGKPQAMQEAQNTVIDWLNYNHFVVGDAILADITKVFDEMGCKTDTDRAWWGDLTYPNIYHPVDRCNLWRQGTKNMSPEAIHNWNQQGVIARFRDNGLGLMLEYTAARYAQLVFVAALDPKQAESMVGDLIKMSANVTGLAISITAGIIAGTAGAVPIVGWILAGIAAIIQGIAAIFNVNSTIEGTRKLRLAISDKIDDILRVWFSIPGGMQKIFPAYWSPEQNSQDFPILVPLHYPMDDIKDPLFMLYALSWTNQVKIVPQLPWHYLKIGFDLPVTIDAVTKDLVMLAPAPDKNGVPFMGYNTKFLAQSQVNKIVW